MRGFAYDGRVAGTALTFFHLFLVSALFLLTTLPYLAFERLVGWQPTHLAVWLGVLSLVPIGPGGFAVLATMRAQRTEGPLPHAPVRSFWRAFDQGFRGLGWWWLGSALLGLIVGYDLSLFGDNDAVFLGASLVVLLVVLTTIALSLGVLHGVTGRPVQLLSATLGTVVRQAYLPASWLLLIACAWAVTQLPVIGGSLALFAPAACGWAIAMTGAKLWTDERPSVEVIPDRSTV